MRQYPKLASHIFKYYRCAKVGGFLRQPQPFEPSTPLSSVLNSCKERLFQFAKDQYLGYGTSISNQSWIDRIQSDLFGRHQQTWPRQLVIQNCLEALYKLQQDYQHSNNLMEVISSTTLRPLKVSHLTKNPASGGPNLALPAASPALPARAVRPTRWIYLEVLLTDCQWWLLPVPVDSWFVSNFCELRCICLKKKGWWFVRVCCVTSYSLVVSYTHQHGMYHQ